jgi:hypothetical protein
MLTFQLSREEAELLRSMLARQVGHIERELVHTDAPAMQHALARDLERAQALLARVERQLEAPGPDAGAPVGPVVT